MYINFFWASYPLLCSILFMRLHECYVCVSLIIFDISLFLFEFRFMLREERKFWNQLGFDGVNGVELTLWCLVNYTRSIFFQSLKKKDWNIKSGSGFGSYFDRIGLNCSLPWLSPCRGQTGQQLPVTLTGLSQFSERRSEHSSRWHSMRPDLHTQFTQSIGPKGPITGCHVVPCK